MSKFEYKVQVISAPPPGHPVTLTPPDTFSDWRIRDIQTVEVWRSVMLTPSDQKHSAGHNLLITWELFKG